MKPIYKNLALESTILAITLSLQASVTANGSSSVQPVEASALEGLKVKLVSPNVSGARDLIASGECVVDGANLVINLDGEKLAQGTHRLSVCMEYGTNTVVLYGLDITVPMYGSLSSDTQEFADDITVVETIGNAAGGLVIDETPTEGSPNPVSSGGVYQTLTPIDENIEEIKRQITATAQSISNIENAHILDFSYDGIIFLDGYEPRGAFGIIAERQYILEVHDDQDTVLPAMTASDYPYIEVFEMQNAIETQLKNDGATKDFLSISTSLRKVILPNIKPYGNQSTLYMFLKECSELRYVDLLNTNFGSTYSTCFASDPKLIDIIVGKAWSASRDLLSGWNPTEALYTDSVSLLTQEDITAGFTSNREKLLYNIREHIAANLPDRTDDTPLTITFSQTLRDAFDQETDDAFAAKNWDIAPARS